MLEIAYYGVDVEKQRGPIKMTIYLDLCKCYLHLGQNALLCSHGRLVCCSTALNSTDVATTVDVPTRGARFTMYVGKVLRLPASGLCVKGPSRTPRLSMCRRSRPYMLRFFLPISPEPDSAGSHSFLIQRAQRWRSEAARVGRGTKTQVLFNTEGVIIHAEILYPG